MLPNVTCVPIYLFTKCILEDSSENFVELAEIYPWRSLLGVATFWTNRSVKYNFLEIYEIFNINIGTNLDCRMWFQYGIINFGFSNFNIDDYSFCSLCEIVVSKNVRQLLHKLACKFYRTVHRFHARVESPTCTIYLNICGKA